MRELTDEMVADWTTPRPASGAPDHGLVPGRHVASAADVARHPDGRRAVITWSSPEIDPGLLNPALHVVAPDGTVTDLGPAPADARTPVWWGDRIVYLALTPPHLQGGMAVFDQDHRNLTEGMPACPTDLVQTGGAPVVVVATGLDTEFHLLGEGAFARVTGSHRPDRRAPLTDVPLGHQERLRYRAPDGLDLDGLLVLPVGRTRADGPFPLITLVHGGPYDRWADDFQLSWVPSAQWLAQQGFASFLPNPRGGLGRGHAFAAAVAGRVGQEEWHDIETGIDLLVAHGVADPDRLGISGWSHGGFMAAWAVTRTDRFRAAFVGAGISDWPKQIAHGECGAFEAALGDSAEHSPITFADRITTPLLIVHGAADTNVPVEQAELLHAAVAHSELVVYPGEGHAITQRANKIDLLDRARRFFATLHDLRKPCATPATTPQTGASGRIDTPPVSWQRSDTN
ncbi:S9 family peptidase [Nocardia sp. NRRL S-836]|uniref:alpha/beta hydrolase family protein n=1 Tax=Nocardia sp. NRRL S-836 TaxID=1519492 RepID=UPI0006AEE616|nr:prolyl oligopeptidase family serine peptidase [Nocardia sp. NRRL S-836]